jgi:hypothetical protein
LYEEFLEDLVPNRRVRQTTGAGRKAAPRQTDKMSEPFGRTKAEED